MFEVLTHGPAAAQPAGTDQVNSIPRAIRRTFIQHARCLRFHSLRRQGHICDQSMRTRDTSGWYSVGRRCGSRGRGENKNTSTYEAGRLTWSRSIGQQARAHAHTHTHVHAHTLN